MRVDAISLLPLLAQGGLATNFSFQQAAQNLDTYLNDLKSLGEHPTCDEVVKANKAPRMVAYLNKAYEMFSNWLSQATTRIKDFRDQLRIELRNAP
jgi:hypothetical protein